MSYKITGLDPLAVGQVADDDELEMIDKSDTSLSASGTNKRVVPHALLATAVPGGTRTVSTLKSYLANNAVFNVKDFGAIGDGATNDTAAFVAAIDAALAAGGGRVRAHYGSYLLDPITVPSTTLHLTIEGEGGGASRATRLIFQGTPGAGANGGIAVPAAESFKIRNLSIEHDGAVAAANGIGLGITGGNYVELDDVWVYGFGINVQFDGFAFYSRFIGLRSIHGYTAGMKWNGALHNGNAFLACQFSNSDAGNGVHINGSGGTANVAFRNCYFEGNAATGLVSTGTGLFQLKLDTCYFEANGDIDLFVDNSLASSIAHVECDTCYFDAGAPASGAQHRRIEVRDGKLTLRNNRFFQVNGASYYTEPPIRIIDSAGGIRGTRPCIAENNEYETPEPCNNMDGWVVVDSKHPGHSTTKGTSPTGLSSHALHAGQFFWNRLESTVARTLGWLVTAGGKGTAANPTVTVTTTAGSAVALVNDTAHPLTTGDYVTIAGTTFDRSGVGGSAVQPWAQIIDVPAGGLRFDGTVNDTLAGAAVSYRQGIAVQVPMTARVLQDVTIAAGVWTSWSALGASSAIHIAESNATGHTARCQLAGGEIYLMEQTDPLTRYVKDNALATADKINIGMSGGGVVIKNNLAVPATFTVTEHVIR